MWADDDETHGGFRGEYDFLSNMYEFEVHYKGLAFPSSEYLYQWLKVEPTAPDAEAWREKILTAPHGRKAKTLTKKRGFPLRQVKDIDEFRLKAMKIALWAKFKQPEMAKKLLATGDTTLVEYNTWRDEFFGICNGVGHNHLGRLLMECRLYLRNRPEYHSSLSSASSSPSL